MKYLSTIVLIIMLTGCVDNSPKIVKQSQTESTLQIGLDQFAIRELGWKGHTYGFTRVHGGISIFHAGHCRCNSVK